ncbi:MAG: hypothetical protein ACI86H_002328, partial [bacterium]
YYAASGLIQLNDSFQTKINKLQEQLEEKPENGSLWYELGSVYDLYCYWNLPESDVMTDFLNRVESCFKKAIALDGSVESFYKDLGRLYVRREQFENAENILSQGIAKYPESAKIAVLYAEVLFELRKLEKLKEIAMKVILLFDVPTVTKDAMYFWAFGDSVSKLQGKQYS